MDRLIVGNDILQAQLFKEGTADPKNLKNSSYDLRIGTIVPSGHHAATEIRHHGDPQEYVIQPKEMVFAVSTEHFRLPSTATGLAMLRTTLTMKGLLTPNLGIIDPGCDGPISTALLNFSDRPVTISVGDSFLRILFFEHRHVDHPTQTQRENPTAYDGYIRDTRDRAYTSFPKTYLNLPSHDEGYLFRIFFRVLASLFGPEKIIFVVLIAFIGVLFALGTADSIIEIVSEWIK